MIAILSIPHSGTHFLAHYLLASEDPFYSHVWPHRVDDYDGWLYHASRCEHVVVPLRHPHAIATSWKRRGKDLGELERYFGVMEKVVDLLLEPLYLPIDAPRYRNGQLQKLSDALGRQRPLWTDWPIVREAKDYPPAELTDDERDAIPVRTPFTQFYDNPSSVQQEAS